MGQSPTIMKWFCRFVLVGLTIVMTYVVTRPGYNFAHWVPHNMLRALGADYSTLLWAEQNADIALHFFGAAILTGLLYGSALPGLKKHHLIPFALVCLVCLGAELAQQIIGRGMETRDLLLGICGSFVAYLAAKKRN